MTNNIKAFTRSSRVRSASYTHPDSELSRINYSKLRKTCFELKLDIFNFETEMFLRKQLSYFAVNHLTTNYLRTSVNSCT